MPRTIKKEEDKELPVVDNKVKKLKEGEALIYNKKTNKEMITNALHAIVVLRKQGWDIKEVNLDLDDAVQLCINYEISYDTPPTKSNLMDVIAARF